MLWNVVKRKMSLLNIPLKMNKPTVAVFYDENRILLPHHMSALFRILFDCLIRGDRIDVHDFELNIPVSSSLALCFSRSLAYWLTPYLYAFELQTQFFQDTLAALGRYDMSKCRYLFQQLYNLMNACRTFLNTSDNFSAQLFSFREWMHDTAKTVFLFTEAEDVESLRDLFEEHLKRVNAIWFRFLLHCVDGVIDLETVEEKEISEWIENQVGLQPESDLSSLLRWVDRSFDQFSYVYQGDKASKRKRKILIL